jgi:hypothetical protein
MIYDVSQSLLLVDPAATDEANITHRRDCIQLDQPLLTLDYHQDPCDQSSLAINSNRPPAWCPMSGTLS